MGTPGFSDGTVEYISFAINPGTEEPYIAYSDWANSHKATVKKFNGTSWVDVGTPGFSTDAITHTSLAFEPFTHEPYVFFSDSTDKARVKKFNGTTWTNVGTGISTFTVNDASIDFNSQAEPYIAYTESAKATVKKFNGTSWINIGNLDTIATQASYAFLVLNPVTDEPTIAYKDGLNSNKATVMKFNSNTVATPFVSPDEGTYTSAQIVGPMTTTTGAAIYYTTDGSTPTTGSTLYSGGGITINTNTTLKAIAVKSGMTNSDVMSKVYVIKNATPIASLDGGTFTSAQSVTLSTTTSGASIYYTTNGSTPTTSSTLYSGAISISQNTTLKAIAAKSGMTDSDVMSEAYVIKSATPTASPTGATFTSAQSVTLSTATSGASIYYTIDGSVPTVSSTLYSGAITVGASETIKAIAVKSGMGDSDVMSESYVINIPGVVDTPTASPAGGSYTSNQTVSLSTTTSGATIYYTTDGLTTPTTSSTQYATPLSITTSTIVKALAVKSGMTDSAIMTSSYSINKSSGSSNKKKSSSHKKKKKKSSPKYTISSVSSVPYGGVLVQSGKKFAKNGNVAVYQSRLNGTYYPPKIVRASATGSFSMATKIYKARGKYSWYAVNMATGAKSKIKTYKVK